MDLLSLLPPESRVIDVGATNADLARTLAAAGLTRYLGLVPAEQLDQARTSAGAIGSRLWPLNAPAQALRASCDVLVLRSPFARLLWVVRDLRDVRFVAVEHSLVPSPRGVEADVARFVSRLRGAASARGRWTAGGTRFAVLELTPKHRAQPRPRHYLSPVVGVDGLAQQLEREGVRYAALRWFETLPELAPGEDLDLLVADVDLATVHRVLAEEPGTIPVDVYSETGLEGADFQNAAYYPPGLARQMLDHAVTHSSGTRVPCPTDHLHSMAYHAVYHKGLRSGLPSTDSARGTGSDAAGDPPEHDYTSVLRDLAQAVGVALPGTLEEIDGYLASVGWRPPPDTVRRLATVNPWVREHVVPETAAGPEQTPEISVFFVRERALTVIGLDDVTAVLDHFGFEVLEARELDDEARSRCTSEARGGNWGRGPFPESGGGPAAVIVALHHARQPVVGAVKVRYPQLTNAEVYFAKRRIRELVDARVPTGERFNPVHSSDDVVDAWHYIELAMPEQIDALHAEADRRAEAFLPTAPVVAELSRGRRARVQVVQSPQGPVVRKTYAEGFRRFLDREVAAIRELGPLVDAVPPLVEVGPNWFSCPLYEDTLPPMGSLPGGRLVPLPVLRQMVTVLRQIHDLGYDLVDAKPQNFVLDARIGLKILDFEFAYRYPEGQVPPFARSYNFVGPPPGFAGDVPVGPTTYDHRWRGHTGLPLDVLVDGSPASQHLHRALFRMQRMLAGPYSPARRGARVARRVLVRARSRASRTFTAWTRHRAEVAAR
ncbi:hypothetical protein DDP54_11410 [Cellulomonas sp. WB94]|uniref:hypothetical protein n=1 Tax=Cellulomonas sp. WB94 TaxID=2173174 RepID=UPI000D57F4A9|nr:hypothetical protein [Cellulomonas sp. WB94]PVU83502.1 hypothetical protein DDP54_11410 [Cellulomonas sp. WB94]